VHRAAIVVAMSEGDGTDVSFFGEIDNTPEAI
jgi:hypothetical protein